MSAPKGSKAVLSLCEFFSCFQLKPLAFRRRVVSDLGWVHGVQVSKIQGGPELGTDQRKGLLDIPRLHFRTFVLAFADALWKGTAAR